MNELQIELKNTLKKYCLANIEPKMEDDDYEGIFREDIYQGLGELGVCGIPISEDFGGLGLDYTTLCVALEEIAKCSPSYAVTISVSTMVQSIINKFGNKKQKEKYLPKLTSGEEIAAFALSESSSGSDAAALKLSAKKAEGGYTLNGNKMWITSAGIAKTYVVLARTGKEGPKGITAFILRDGAKGFSIGKKERKIGWNISPTREIIFDNCFIPEEDILGKVDEGFKIALNGLDAGRVTIGSIGLGVSQRCINESVKYTLGRKQFGKELMAFQGLQFMMADMAVEVESARAIVYLAANLIDKGTSSAKIGSMAKLKATETAMSVSTDAVQILGGVGVTKEYPVERFMRDAKILQIVEGTNQIQKVVIARELKKELE